MLGTLVFVNVLVKRLFKIYNNFDFLCRRASLDLDKVLILILFSMDEKRENTPKSKPKMDEKKSIYCTTMAKVLAGR